MEKHRDRSGTGSGDSAPPGISDATRPPGRPRHNADELKQSPLSIRTTASLKRALEEAAKASGRSLAREIEYRLRRSFAGVELLATEDDVIGHLDEAVGDLGWRLDEVRDILREVRKIHSLGEFARPFISMGKLSVKIRDDGKAVLIRRRGGLIIDVFPLDLEPASGNTAGSSDGT